MAGLNTENKNTFLFRLFYIGENDSFTTIMIKWKPVLSLGMFLDYCGYDTFWRFIVEILAMVNTSH